MRVAVVGATGLVGSVMLKILEERRFPAEELFPVASEASVGKKILFRWKKIPVITLKEALTKKCDLALFSAGGSTSKEWAPKFAETGTTVIDNSSAWRMDPNIKLVVPEINADQLTKKDKIIANPNCSTIQMVVALAPLHYSNKIKRVVVSTYQSVTGTGAKALKQLHDEQQGIESEKIYNHPIHQNVIPHCDVFSDDGYTKEELKMVNETCKILNDNSIKISATAVRVPVLGGHSESLNVEFTEKVDLENIRGLLAKAEGITIVDDPDSNQYPMPLMAQGKDDVFVGRIRIDNSQLNTINMFVVSDNLRKGAATNAIQIAEKLIELNLLERATSFSS
jgi:aspartate-semialdehyde dehydrogenase